MGTKNVKFCSRYLIKIKNLNIPTVFTISQNTFCVFYEICGNCIFIQGEEYHILWKMRCSYFLYLLIKINFYVLAGYNQ